MNEKHAAWGFSQALDRALMGEAVSPPADEAALLGVAQRLARLPQLLPAVEPAFERRVLARAADGESRPRPARLQWQALAPALAVLLLLLGLGLFTPPGRTVLAELAARFHLGRFAVQVTPQPGGGGESFVVAAQELLASVEEAQALVDYDVLTPQVLPPGYALRSVTAVSYEGMPVWIPQPFYLELEYRAEGDPGLHHLTLREFGLAVREGEYMRRIRQVDFASRDVSRAEDMFVGEMPAVLLTMVSEPGVPAVRRLIWQQGEVVVELLSQTLSGEEMLSVAATMSNRRITDPAGAGSRTQYPTPNDQ
ncbi:MAG: hypothetical protein QHJ81_15380 [Anaerolineae bacterium]|nr:hypothetical protein [Anaerolineae bacterium]